MQVIHHDGPSAFLVAAGAFLERHEAEHALMLGLAASMTTGERDPAGALFATVTDAAGEPLLAAMRTPPRSLIVSRAEKPAIGALVDDLSVSAPDLPGINGPREPATQFATAWTRRHGGSFRETMGQHLHVVERVESPHPASGAMVPATGDDVPLLAAWARAFSEEAGTWSDGKEEDHVRNWVGYGQLFTWRDPGVVAMALWQGKTRHGVRIGLVYTPPERRRRGYASNLVAALTRRLLDEGRTFCMLYTDVKNPTSNAIYRRLGYRPIADTVEFAFSGD
ncbi:MAG: GNAT family N-acetyltransferase [Planctomycetota bacterium]